MSLTHQSSAAFTGLRERRPPARRSRACEFATLLAFSLLCLGLPAFSQNTVQFGAASESASQVQGTFSIPVELTGPAALATTQFVSLNNASAIAFNSAGIAYVVSVSNSGSNVITELNPTGTVLSSNLAPSINAMNLYALALDAAGNLYVSDVTGNAVLKLSPVGEVLDPHFGAGAKYSEPASLAFDAAGNLYVANYGGNYVIQISPTGQVLNANFGAAANFSAPLALAFDPSGNLYVADTNGISQLTPAGTVLNGAFSMVGGARGLAFDPAGNLYVSIPGNMSMTSGNMVTQLSPTGAVLNANVGTGYNNPGGLGFDASGNLYVADGNGVEKISSTVSVPFTTGGTAVAGTDYGNLTSSPLGFGVAQSAPGVITATITGQLLPGSTAGNTLSFSLGTPNGAAVGGAAANTLTITSAPSALFTGSFQGLAFTPDGAESYAATATVSAGGAFSLALKSGSSSLSAKGALDPAGHGFASIPRRGLASLSVRLALDLSGHSNLAITDGSVTAATALYPAAALAKTASAGLAGKYTLLAPPPSSATGVPQGYGYATVTVAPTGAITMAGLLGDGEPFAAGAQLLAASPTSDAFVLYTPVYSAPSGFIYGLLTFPNPASASFSGALQWHKPKQTKTGLFQDGFQLTASVAGSSYTPPAKGLNALNLASGTVTATAAFTGGNLASILNKSLSIAAAPSNAVTVVVTGADKLRLTINAASGAISGSFIPMGAKSPATFTGVLSQSQSMAAGVFTGTTETGSVVISL